jgi:CRISPR-associated protein Cmr2
LFCFPTFFDQIGLEIINPHDRERRVGKNPILFECVPAGATGTFRLLYVPYDFPGEVTPNGGKLLEQVQADLPLVAEAVRDLLTVYGFGAKTSSGFGTAEDRLATEGKLILRAKLRGVTTQTPAKPEPEPAPDLPRYLESPTRLHPDFRRPDGSLKTEEEYQALIEGRGQKYARRDRQLYAKAKAWWEREGRALAEAPTEEPEPGGEPAPAPSVAEWAFTTIGELPEVAQKVATLLREGGAA